MPTASRLGRRHRSDAVRRTSRRDRRARNYADGRYMPTAAVGVSLGKPTAFLGRRSPLAYVCIAQRLYYANGLDMAVGIALTRPTVAVGIDMAVGIGPCSGSATSPPLCHDRTPDHPVAAAAPRLLHRRLSATSPAAGAPPPQALPSYPDGATHRAPHLRLAAPLPGCW